MRCHSSRHRMKGAALSTIALLISNVDASVVANVSMRSARAIVNTPMMTNYRQLSAATFVSDSGFNRCRKRPRSQSHGSSWMPNDTILAPHHASAAPRYQIIRSIATTTTPLHAKPKSGSIVDSYQTVSVNCSKCRTRLFRYKKKNGTKSNLIKCYIERISEDSAGLLESFGIGDGYEEDVGDGEVLEGQEWSCPDCGQRFGRRTLIHGRPAIKLVGGKVRMTKK